MKRSLLYLISILILLNPVYSQFKNLTKQLKSKAVEKVKEVVDENVKPLTIDYNIKKIHYN